MEGLFDEYIADIYDNMQEAYANLFLIAIKKKINLKHAVELATELIEPYIEQVDCFTPEGMNGLVFLSVVAKMLDCSLFDILYMKERDKERIILNVFDNLEESDIYVSEGSESVSFNYTIKDSIGTEITYEFTLEKGENCAVIVEQSYDGEYGFSTDYMYDSMVLWEGNSGKVYQFIVSTIADIPNEETEFDIENAFQKSIEANEEDSIIDYKDFFVHSKRKHCNHKTIKVMATVPIYADWNVKTITFPADYCAECGIYYLSEFDYQNKIVPVGRLLCQVMSQDEYSDYKNQMEYNGELKPQSVLNIIGYNVNAKDNLSEHERRTILRYAIESGIITKKLSIFYLQTFIKKNSSKPGLQEAIDKWRSDLQWLYDYNNNGKIIYGVRRIITNSLERFMNAPENTEDNLPFK